MCGYQEYSSIAYSKVLERTAELAYHQIFIKYAITSYFEVFAIEQKLRIIFFTSRKLIRYNAL